MNLPNSITMTRILMIPLFLWILSPHFPWQGASGAQEIAASILFVLASITDGLDGYLARKRGQITTMGMLLDPLADKIMVTAALIALVAYNPQVVKVKTVVQIVSVVSAILAHRWDHWQIGVVVVPVKWYAIAAVYFTVLVSTISAVDYFVGFWKKIDHASKDRRQTAVLSRGKSVRIS